jgi:hypothetical protein
MRTMPYGVGAEPHGNERAKRAGKRALLGVADWR